MKKALVDETTGKIRCPNCGSTEFARKRSGKSKAMLWPVAFLLLFVPKRLKCLGCGKLVKAG